MNGENFKTGVINPIECFKEGWELIKSDYWLLFAISIVGALIGGFSLYILTGAMLCGIYFCFLRKIDTGTVSFDDLWKGFSYFLPGFLVMLIIIIPLIFIYGIIYVPFILKLIMGSAMSSDEMTQMFFGALAIDAVLAVFMVCFHTLLIFAFPLIVDKQMSAGQAVKTSVKAVWQNLSGIAGIIAIQFGLSILGLISCGIGLYFLLPIMLAGFTVAYRKIFPSLKNQNFNPPPPNAYQGAGSYT